MRDSVIAKKKLRKIVEYVKALQMDLQDGTLKRMAPSKNIVQRLSLENISEDSDEDMETFYSKKSPGFSEYDLS